MLTEAPGRQEGLGVIRCILANLQLRHSGGDGEATGGWSQGRRAAEHLDGRLLFCCRVRLDCAARELDT